MLEIIIYFFRLGLLGFGGPLALVAQMQKDLVEERGWISPSEFGQSLALIKSMPGPLAFSVASYLGTRRRGFWGGIAAGWLLVLPAALMMVLLAIYYDRFFMEPMVEKLLWGMQAMALAIIIFSIKSLVQSYFNKWMFWILLTAAVILNLATVPEAILILSFGSLSIVLGRWIKTPTKVLLSLGPFIFLADEKIRQLMWICFKSGALVFGSGLAIVPILELDFVQEMHWLTHSQFMDALAFGQMTPGPVLVTVTFVGYKVSGLAGAIVATVSVFLASSFHMTTWFPRMISWFSRQAWIPEFVMGALAAVVGTLAMVTGKLFLSGTDGQRLITLLGILVLYKWKIPSWLVILTGAGLGILFL